jgi:hypothetical protein
MQKEEVRMQKYTPNCKESKRTRRAIFSAGAAVRSQTQEQERKAAPKKVVA